MTLNTMLVQLSTGMMKSVGDFLLDADFFPSAGTACLLWTDVKKSGDPVPV